MSYEVESVLLYRCPVHGPITEAATLDDPHVRGARTCQLLRDYLRLPCAEPVGPAIGAVSVRRPQPEPASADTGRDNPDPAGGTT